ncbi:MAG: class I SAM-dependent RNA methyltransferase [Deltaproteobacteria bacterium]|nr:class I SAM-dependent RNA methyltransferase [Deltaproteobacteria bacterium]
MDCRHHPACPGCPLLPLPYSEQLAHKQARLSAAFARYPHLPPAPAVAPARHTEAYRHRLKLPLDVRKDGVRIGLYDRSGHTVLDTPDCPVLAEGLRAALPPLLGALAGLRGLHSLDLRVTAAKGELQAVIAADEAQLPGGFGNALRKAVPGLKSVAVSRADPDHKKVMGSRPRLIAGETSLDEQIGDTRLKLHPGAFFQVDPRTAADLHATVKALVGDAKRVLDLYAGVGAYALMLAPGRDEVVMIEEVPTACASARAVAPANVKVIEGKVEDQDLSKLGPFDCVVLNPARKGSDPAALARIARVAHRVVYVSCGPETLARDLDCLAAHGLRVQQVQAIDLFPQTPEVEAVVLLERGVPLRRISVQGGNLTGPWTDDGPGEGISGALGRAQRAVVLVIGDPGEAGHTEGARWRRLGLVAGHALLRLELLDGRLIPALASLARLGHPVAGRHAPTARFFSEKAGLVRPFVHVEKANELRAPLHGDLVAALDALGADRRLIARAGGPRTEEGEEGPPPAESTVGLGRPPKASRPRPADARTPNKPMKAGKANKRR